MFKILRYLTSACLAIGLVTMALANRAPVDVHFLPDSLSALFGVDLAITLPLFLVLFLAMIAGLLVGFVWEWLREHKHRSAARSNGREVSRLERELAVMKDSSGTPKDDILALLDRPKTAQKSS